MNKNSREDVFGAVVSERIYQQYRWPDDKHSNVEYLVYIQHYVNEALKVASTSDEAGVLNATRDALRKIAALAVAAQEENGVLIREGW